MSLPHVIKHGSLRASLAHEKQANAVILCLMFHKHDESEFEAANCTWIVTLDPLVDITFIGIYNDLYPPTNSESA